MNDPTLNQFLKENPVGVISTLGPRGVEAASVYYLVDTDGTIYFNSRRDTRKLKNILENPDVAFVAFQGSPAMTLQAKGKAEIVKDIGTIVETYTALLKRVFSSGKIPPILNIGMSEVELVKVTPSWMRFGNFSEKEKSDMFTILIDTDTKQSL